MKIKIGKVTAVICAVSILMPLVAGTRVYGGTEGLTHYVTVSKSGSNTYLPEGTSYLKYGCTFQNQGTHSEICEGFVTGAGRPSSQHEMSYTLQGHARVTLYDRASRTTTVLVDSYGDNNGGELDLDPTHDYDVMLEAYGGSTIVTCMQCGYVKKYLGSFTIFFEAWGRYGAQITSQPQDAAGNCGESVSFGISGKCITAYQWQMCINDTWTNIYDGALSSDGMAVSNCNKSVLTVSGLTSAINGTRVRCMVRGRDGNQVASNEARITTIDNKGPSVSVSKSTEDPVAGPVILTVNASDADSGLPEAPYSYNGAGYCSINTFEVSENSVVEVAVMDRAGNVTKESVSITNISVPQAPPEPAAPVVTAVPTKEPEPSTDDTPAPAPAKPAVTPTPTAAPAKPAVTPTPTAAPAKPAVIPTPTAAPAKPAVNPTPTANPVKPAVTPTPTAAPVKPAETSVPVKKPTEAPSIILEVSSSGGNTNTPFPSQSRSENGSGNEGRSVGNENGGALAATLPSVGLSINDQPVRAEDQEAGAAAALTNGTSSKNNRKSTMKKEDNTDAPFVDEQNDSNRDDAHTLLVVREDQEPDGDEYGVSSDEPEDEISIVEEDLSEALGKSPVKPLVVSGEVVKNRKMPVWAIVLLIVAGILILLLLVYVLLLGVLILYEKEEDEDYSDKKRFRLAGLSLLSYRDGIWRFRIKEELYELAPLTLKYGPVFTALFEGWDMEITIKPLDEEEEPEVLKCVVYQNAVIK
ncbi:MAG: hypothetical protein K5770_01805 [Lachnospiraceae bacterium]|nr:hypothetical protein [Lachnospiraceae bacterium]